MQIINHARQEKEDWREGVTTVMLVSAVNSASQLCIFDQYCAPGLGAPTHLHAVEEVLSVIEGKAEIWLGDARKQIETGESLIIPAGYWHGFTNLLQTTLHVRATLAAPVFEASYDDRAELSRRFLPPASQKR
ncbi:MAG: mannose-6-phosphate isomerase-like protein (cupin superfamily) [Alphaproteobacteria bacterium]|jgi:mannose-6-phosphate isomerase-like protein (cupin superfamily)